MFATLKKDGAAEKHDVFRRLAEKQSMPELASASLATFTSHWCQVKSLIRKNGSGPGKQPMSAADREAVLQYVDKLCMLLADECPGDGTDAGPVLAYAVDEQFFDAVVNWCVAAHDQAASRTCLLGLLRAFEHVIAHSQQQLLQHASFARPLLALLSTSGELAPDAAVDESLVVILHSLCLAARADTKVLEVLFDAAIIGAAEQKPSFLVFSLLVPYIHREGLAGQRARDALLLVMSASAHNDNVGLYIAEKSDFCPVLAAGLSALYSMLPRKIKAGGDAWHQIEESDYAATPEVVLIVNALSFCNAVVQVAHSAISAQLVAFIYEGFLIPVLGPALHQNSSSEVITATAYLSLLLRHVSEPALMRAFLRFILIGRHDDTAVIDTLVARIGGHSKMCMVSLSLFSVLLDLCCEDVMYQLVFRYLLPCSHVMPSQKRIIAEADIYNKSAEKFLSLVPQCCLTDVHAQTGGTKLFEQPVFTSMCGTSPAADGSPPRSLFEYTTDYSDYLADAHCRVTTCAHRCRSWRFTYDGPRAVASSNAPDSGMAMLVASQKYDIPPTAASRLLVSGGEAGLVTAGVEPTDAADDVTWLRPPSVSAPARLCAEWESDHSTTAVSGGRNADESSVGTFISYVGFVGSDEWSHCAAAQGGPQQTGAQSQSLTVADGSAATNSVYRGVEVVHSVCQQASAHAGHGRQQQRQLATATAVPFRQPSSSVDAVRDDQSKRDSGRRLIGPFLSALLGKLEQMMHNSLYVNLMLTGVIAQLASYPHPLIRSLLLNSHLMCQPDVRTLAMVLGRIKQKIDEYARATHQFGLLLLEARSSLWWKEELALSNASRSSNRSGRQSSPVASSSPPQLHELSEAKKLPEKRRLRFPSLLFSRAKAKEPASHSGGSKNGTGYQYVSRPDDISETPAARLEALTLKNAVYCAIVLEEFAKELAALAQEHTIFAVGASDEGYHSGIR